MPGSRMPRLARALGLAICLPICSLGQNAPASIPAPLKLDEILTKMAAREEARLANLEFYTSIRQYKLENIRFGATAGLEVRMRYKRPGVKTFELLSGSGSSVLRSRVLERMIKAELEAAQPSIHGSTQITPDNYRFKLAGMEDRNGRPCYLLEAVPIVATKFLFRGKVCVDAEEFAVARIEASPALNPSFWIRKTVFVHEYRKFGPHWLPVLNRSDTQARLFGRTAVSLAYNDYKINEVESSGDPRKGLGMITLDGAGGAADDWRPQPAADHANSN